MAEWLSQAIHADLEMSMAVLTARLAAAFVLGCVVAALYRLTTGRGNGPSFLGTLVMLSVLITLLTVVIGSSQARAFTLVGALAIVRFRTVVADTRDTAFVIYAVAAGMACGTGFPLAAVAATPLLAVAAWVFRPDERRGTMEASLVLRLGVGTAAETAMLEVLREEVPGYRLVSLATARGGAALEMHYLVTVSSAEKATALVGRLTGLNGVQSVELKLD